MRTIPLALCFCLFSASASAKDVVAVFDIEVSGLKLKRTQARGLNNYLHGKIAQMPNYAVVPRADVQRRLQKEKANSYRACYDEACQIEIGKELAAQKTLSTKIFKLGDECVVSVVIYDLRSAASAGAADASGTCRVSALVRSIETAVLKAAQGKASTVVRQGEVDKKACPLPDTRRLGEAPPEGRRVSCINADNRQHGLTVTYHANGEVASRTNFRDGRADGETELFYDNGRLQERGQHRQGKRTGTWTRWTQQGQKRSEGPYKKGVRSGDWTEFSGDGRRRVTHYENDLQHGPSVQYLPSGELREKGQYERGDRTGVWTAFESGKVRSTYTYDRDKRNGLYQRFNDSGLFQEFQYEDDKKNGPSKQWGFRDGQRFLQFTTEYRDGKKHGLQRRFRPDGSIDYEWPHIEGKKSGVVRTFKEDGRVSSETEYVADKKEGPYVQYGFTPDGTRYLKSKGQHRAHKKFGEWLEYHPDGQLAVTRTFANGRQTKRISHPKTAAKKSAVPKRKGKEVWQVGSLGRVNSGGGGSGYGMRIVGLPEGVTNVKGGLKKDQIIETLKSVNGDLGRCSPGRAWKAKLRISKSGRVTRINTIDSSNGPHGNCWRQVLNKLRFSKSERPTQFELHLGPN